MRHRGVAWEVSAEIEPRSCRRGDGHAVDPRDLVSGDAFPSRDDASRRVVVRPQQLDGSVVVDPTRAVQSRCGSSGDHSLASRPQPGALRPRRQGGLDILGHVDVRIERAIVPSQRRPSDGAFEHGLRSDDDVPHEKSMRLPARASAHEKPWLWITRNRSQEHYSAGEEERCTLARAASWVRPKSLESGSSSSGHHRRSRDSSLRSASAPRGARATNCTSR